MKKFLLLIVIIIGVGVILFQTNKKFQSSIKRWYCAVITDCIEESVDSDTTTQTRRSIKKHSDRPRIAKKLKPDKFTTLDNYARTTPEEHTRNIQTLANYLVKPAKNDLEKARLLYTWIATHIKYDANAINTGVYDNQLSAENILIKRKAVCEGYSSLFKALGLSMGLDVEKIIGYSKISDLDKIPEPDHAWNAVKVNNNWQLVDVTWGSGYGFTKGDKLEAKASFDPYWFCVEPHEFIFTHLPENQNWQLTDTSITLKQFERLPYLNGSFFKLGFNGQEIYKKALSGNTQEIVTTYHTEFPVKGIALPLNKIILRNKAYSFVLQSDYVEEMAIIDGQQWTYFEKKNGNFSILYMPLHSTLEIAAKFNWFENKFHTILKYDIEDEKI